MMNSRNCFTIRKLSKLWRLSSQLNRRESRISFVAAVCDRRTIHETRSAVIDRRYRNYSGKGGGVAGDSAAMVASSAIVVGAAGSTTTAGTSAAADGGAGSGGALGASFGVALADCFLFFLIKLRTVSDGCAPFEI